MEGDPQARVAPDFASEAYAQPRQRLVERGMTEEEATQFLLENWQTARDADTQRWLDAHPDQPQGEEDNIPELAIIPDTVVPDFLAPKPATSILRKLAAMEYVGLYYFTVEGCREAQLLPTSLDEDMLSLAKTGDGIVFKPTAVIKATRNALRDDQLTWKQVSIAKTGLMTYIQKYGWPGGLISSLGRFFTALELHDFHHRPYGEAALIQYQAAVREQWHEELRVNKQAFDIGNINDTLLNSYYGQVLNRTQLESVNR